MYHSLTKKIKKNSEEIINKFNEKKKKIYIYPIFNRHLLRLYFRKQILTSCILKKIRSF